MSDEYVPVCEVDDIPDVRPLYADVGGRGILVCKSGDEIFAVSEICPHENRSMRYGVVQRGRIICPHHRYQFDLESGRCRQRCAPVTIFDVEVDGETVRVHAPWMEAP